MGVMTVVFAQEGYEDAIEVACEQAKDLLKVIYPS